MGLAAYGYKPRSAYARRYRLGADCAPYYLSSRKIPWWAVAPVRAALRSEYERNMTALTAAYNAATPAQQARIEQADNDFNACENPLPFIRWARTVVPGAFPVDMRLRAVDEARRQAEVIRQQAEAGYANASPTALEQPPGEILYHGSRNAERVRMEGLFASPEDEICEGDDEYGWERCWKGETWASYRHDLSSEQRRRFHKMIGLRPTSGGMLGRYVALFWASKRIETARSFGRRGGVFMLDQAKIRYYWWFRDEILGERSYVFVCPRDNVPAVPPSGLVLLP